jgi:hypothetical protein
MLAIMQPYFMPYIGYWQLIGAVETFVILDDVTFINKGWINRNRILVQGRPWTFTVPLRHASQNVLIMNLRLAENIDAWRGKFLKTVGAAYKKAPRFDAVMVWVEQSVSNPSPWFIDWLRDALLSLSRLLGLNAAFKRSSEILPSDTLKGQDRILALCRHEQTATYINPINGQGIYQREAFQAQGIDLRFLQTDPTLTYRQFGPGFTPHLSIIDVLMFNTPDETSTLLKQYALI